LTAVQLNSYVSTAKISAPPLSFSASCPLRYCSSAAYARVVDMRNRLTTAAESASLEAAQALRDGLSDNQIETRAQSSFETDAASARKLGRIETPSITVDREKGTVTIQVTGKIATTVSRVAGFEEIPVPVISKTVYPLRDARGDPTASSNHRASFQKRA